MRNEMYTPGPGTRYGRIRNATVIALLAFAVVVNFLPYRAFAIEDAYITYRYAANIAAGEGFVFNAGERVLGTSTPLYALLLSVFALLGLDLVTTGAFLYTLSLSLCGYAGLRLLERLGYPDAGALFALAAAWGFGNVLGYFGMETALYLALIFFALLFAFEDRPLTAGILLGLVSTTRYDGALIASVVLLLRWARTKRFPWREAMISGGILGIWLIFAQWYFGDAFPNSLDAKARSQSFLGYLGASFAAQYEGIFSPIRRFLTPGSAIPLVLPAASVVLVIPSVLRAPVLLRRLWTLPLIAALLWLGYAAIAPPPGHHWYLAPSTYCMLAVFLAGWEEALRWLRAARFLRIAVLALILSSFIALVPAVRNEFRSQTESPMYTTRNEAYELLRRWITDRGLDDSTLLTREVGYIAYGTRLRVIDGAGLVTKGIFYHGSSEKKTSLEAMIDRFKPDLIVWRVPTGTPPPVFRESYAPAYLAQPERLLMVRRDLLERRLDRILENRLEGRALHPGGQPSLRHPLDMDFERGSTHGWNSTGRMRTFVGRPLKDLHFQGALVEDAYLHTHGRNPARTGTLWSDPFLIDFDELRFRFTGTHSRQTAAQLFVDGLGVIDVGGKDTEASVELREHSMPVYTWRNRIGTLRFMDTNSRKGFLVADRVRSYRYENAILIEDFDSGEYGDLWATGFGAAPLPARTLALELGLQFALGSHTASSLFEPGVRRLISRPFGIEQDHLSFVLLDFGGSDTHVDLSVGGRTVRRVHGSMTRRMTAIEWDVSPWNGMEGVLSVVDQDPSAERGIGIDSILLFGRKVP